MPNLHEIRPFRIERRNRPFRLPHSMRQQTPTALAIKKICTDLISSGRSDELREISPTKFLIWFDLPATPHNEDLFNAIRNELLNQRVEDCNGFLYMGFWISRSGGPDAPWIARHDDGRKVRADSKSGVKELVRNEVRKIVKEIPAHGH